MTVITEVKGGRSAVMLILVLSGLVLVLAIQQGWAQGSFVEAEADVKAERSRQRRGKSAMSLTEARQGVR